MKKIGLCCTTSSFGGVNILFGRPADTALLKTLESLKSCMQLWEISFEKVHFRLKLHFRTHKRLPLLSLHISLNLL